MQTRKRSLAAVVTLFALAGALGGACVVRRSQTATGTREHEHAAVHGGLVRFVGATNHAEAVFDADGRTARVFVQGVTPDAPFPLAAPALAARFTPAGGGSPAPLTLRASALPGESEGIASQFVGALPETVGAKPAGTLSVSVPLPGGLQQVLFNTPSSAASSGGTANANSAPLVTERERALFFTPCGLYTHDDIRANGDQTPAQRFRGQMARHNQRPRKGVRVCQISGTEANPAFSWIIGGKRYLFCCPPCVQEFGHQAKQKPGTVRAPDDYVQKT